MYDDAVLKASPMRNATYATLFAYMYRRFGVPALPGDGYKDLCGGWMLTTPSRSLLVLVRPSLVGPELSFTPLYVHEVRAGAPKAHDIADLDLSAQEVADLKQAYQMLLLDLLRPVGVRDANMNALGEVMDDARLMRADKNGDLIYGAERHASAGHGVPLGLVGGKSWPALCALIVEAGQGDIEAGSAKVVDLLRAMVLIDVANEALPVKRLILLGMRSDGPIVGASMGLTADDLQRLLGESEILARASFEQDQTGRIDAMLEETTDDVVAKACEHLTRLGYEKYSVTELVHRALISRAVPAVMADLANTCDGELPNDFVTELLRDRSEDTTTLEKSMRLCFEARGHVHLVAWLDRTLARRRGSAALAWAVLHLRSQAQQQTNHAMPRPQAA